MYHCALHLSNIVDEIPVNLEIDVDAAFHESLDTNVLETLVRDRFAQLLDLRTHESFFHDVAVRVLALLRAGVDQPLQVRGRLRT